MCEGSENIDCVVSDASIMRNYDFFKKLEKNMPFKKQRKERKVVKDTINLLFLLSYYAMPFILKEMVQSMMCTSFSGKEDICTNNSTFTDKRQLTENAHGGKKSYLWLHFLLWMISWSVTMSGISSVHLKKASNPVLMQRNLNHLNQWCSKSAWFLPIHS